MNYMHTQFESAIVESKCPSLSLSLTKSPSVSLRISSYPHPHTIYLSLSLSLNQPIILCNLHKHCSQYA